MKFLHLLQKDIWLLWRSPTGILSMLLMSFALSFLFHFAIGRVVVLDLPVLRGLKWTIVFLTSFILINQSTWEEKEAGAYRILSGVASKTTIFLSKSLVLGSAILLVEALFLLGFLVLFPHFLWENFWLSWSMSVVGVFSLSFLGTSLSAISEASRKKEIVLPVLMMPFSLPIFLICIESEARVSSGMADWSVTIPAQGFLFLFYLSFGILLKEVGD